MVGGVGVGVTMVEGVGCVGATWLFRPSTTGGGVVDVLDGVGLGLGVVSGSVVAGVGAAGAEGAGVAGAAGAGCGVVGRPSGVGLGVMRGVVVRAGASSAGASGSPADGVWAAGVVVGRAGRDSGFDGLTPICALPPMPAGTTIAGVSGEISCGAGGTVPDGAGTGVSTRRAGGWVTISARYGLTVAVGTEPVAST